jgi:cytochrome b561
MQLANSKTRYGTVPQTVHWLTVIFVLCGFLLGQFGDVLPKGPARDTGLLVHMTLGQCVFALVLIRLVWRTVNPPPPPEATPFGRILVIAARVSHYTLYALLLTVPFLGMIVQLKRGNALPIFGIWEFASPWPLDKALARSVLEVHGTLADALLILAGVHASAALIHHWVWRDRTLRRMLPGAAPADARASTPGATISP